MVPSTSTVIESPLQNQPLAPRAIASSSFFLSPTSAVNITTGITGCCRLNSLSKSSPFSPSSVTSRIIKLKRVLPGCFHRLRPGPNRRHPNALHPKEQGERFPHGNFIINEQYVGGLGRHGLNKNTVRDAAIRPLSLTNEDLHCQMQ